jgi:hypothetical protein
MPCVLHLAFVGMQLHAWPPNMPMKMFLLPQHDYRTLCSQSTTALKVTAGKKPPQETRHTETHSTRIPAAQPTWSLPFPKWSSNHSPLQHPTQRTAKQPLEPLKPHP